MRKCLVILLVLVALLSLTQPVSAVDPLYVFFVGPEGSLKTTLSLDKSVQYVSEPGDADLIFITAAIPDPGRIRELVNSGKGLILIANPGFTDADLTTLLGNTVSLEPREDALSLSPVDNISDPILEEINWTSSPQIRERLDINPGGFTPLVTGFEDGSLVLGSRELGSGLVYLFSGQLDDSNPQFQEWTYFNYFIHFMAQNSAGRTPQSFSDYYASPVPHEHEQRIILAILAVILLGAVLSFWLVRRYSLRHPEALDLLVVNPEEFKRHEAQTDWEVVGFHRPLGGFFMALFLGLVLFVPIVIYQNLILPVYILPSAQALGIWGRVVQFFALIWTFFDMGTSVAFIKYFSQLRVHDPREGVKYGQVFIWWQVLSGAIQVAVMVVLASTVMPKTAYAIYAWSVVIHTMIQIPGFYNFYRYSFTGLQRFDYAQILDLGAELVFAMFTQPIFVTIMVLWGKNHPIFGQSLGGLFGMGIAAYATLVIAFVLGLFFFKRLGYTSRPYFLAHFDWGVIKNAFRFGLFDMLGSAAVGLGQSLEILITQTRLVNYAEVWGNWMIAQNFIFAYQVISTLYSNLMPSISEGISHARKTLCRYYSAVGYQWGGMISAMLCAILLATGPRFILGATGPEFVRAAGYLVPLAIWGAVQYPSWVGDNVQRGSNRPWLIVILVGMEQIIRITLAFLLIERFQINALIIAYLVGILIKDLVGYFVNNRVCYQQSFYPWQSLVAPILAGSVFFIILYLLGNLVWKGDQVTSILLFFLAILPAYPIFAFLYAFFGGWEDGTLEEVHRAAELSSFMKPFARLFYTASRLGARISPLHNRFKIPIRSEALAEAASLTNERVSLVDQS
jgi:O-antigen/teichoic acid export membrane protein